MLLKYSFLGVLIVCVTLTAAQQNRNVYNFKIASWNTNGQRWESVKHLMETEAIDVMGVQEAGTLPSYLREKGSKTTRTTTTTTTPKTRTTTSATDSAPKMYIVGEMEGSFQEDEFPTIDFGLTEKRLDNSYYLYYYDRMCTTNGVKTKKQNIAIVSKERAQAVYLFPPETLQNAMTKTEAECDDRLFVNRPTIGIRIENSFFFTLHTEPLSRNEAELIINLVNQFMKQKHKESTWILMGDFNQTPDAVQTHKLPKSMKPQIVSPREPTHVNKILDFGIVGGPDGQAALMRSMSVKRLSDLNGGIGNEIASDHCPIKFYKQ